MTERLVESSLEAMISWNGRAMSWYKYILYRCRVFSMYKLVCVVSPAIICYCAIISNELKTTLIDPSVVND